MKMKGEQVSGFISLNFGFFVVKVELDKMALKLLKNIGVLVFALNSLRGWYHMIPLSSWDAQARSGWSQYHHSIG
jgi:hypothetical protein